MLKIVNEELFSFTPDEGVNNYGHFVKLMFNTSPDIIKTPEGTDDMISSVRTFARLISPDKDYQKYNLAVSGNYPDNQHAQILFKCTPEIKYDQTVYVVAIPFNGIIMPIPESKQYRILKGMVSVSDKYSVSFNNRKFKKILYLIISPNVSLFNDAEHPLDCITMKFDTYSYNKQKDENQPKTSAHETMTLNILPTSYNTVWTKETVPSVNMDEYKAVDIFKLYKIPNNHDNVKPEPAPRTVIGKAYSEAVAVRKIDPTEVPKSAPAYNNNRTSYNNNRPYVKHNDKDDDDGDQRPNYGKKKSQKRRR